MELLKAPTADDDALDLWKVVAKVVNLVNALADVKVVANLVRSKLNWTESAATLEILGTGGSGGAAAELYPWQPYAAPYVGEGDAPADQGLNLMIRAGTVNGTKIPARKNLVIPVPANCTDGYYAWLEADLDAGGNMVSLDYGHGLTLPDALLVTPTDDGAYPATVYTELFHITSNETTVDYANVVQQWRTPLVLKSYERQSDVQSSYEVVFVAAAS